MKKYYPEGQLINTVENCTAIKSELVLQEAMTQGQILEARAVICDNNHNLIVDIPAMKGIIPREEGALGIREGVTRDIALISKVNKPVCFKITTITKDENGNPIAFLSRRKAQEECLEAYLSTLASGDIIPARVTHLEQFGAFVDIGCGIPSLIPIDAISVSRISHPADRFHVGQDIKVIVKSNQSASAADSGKIWLSHKELLGTWEENAALFHAGETVAGIVRSIESYGVFIELTPNLAGLAEPRENVYIGQHASVYIKALIPEKMKVKLIIVDVFDASYSVPDIRYFCNDGHISSWIYTPDGSDKLIESHF